MRKIWILWTALALAAGGCAAKPAINSFTADKTTVEAGNAVTLQWRVIDAESLEISGLGPVPVASTSVTVTPSSTTTYTLTATNGGGTTTSEAITVTVTPRLDVSGGTFATTDTLGRTFAVVLRELSGAIPAAATTVSVTPPGGTPFTVSCPGGQPMCLVVEPDVAPTAGRHTATATVGGVSVTHLFDVAVDSRMFAAGPVFSEETSSTTVSASWGPSPGAVSYRVKLVNASGTAVGPEQIVTTTSATLTSSATLTGTERVAIEASAVDLTGQTAGAEVPPAPNVAYAETPLGGDPDAWRMFPPENFAGNTLTISLPSLGLGERAAVIVLNVGGEDYLPTAPEDNVTVSVTGTSSIPQRDTGPVWEKWSPEVGGEPDGRRAHSAFRALDDARVNAALASGKPTQKAAPSVAPAPVASTATYCVRVGQENTFTRRNVTLRHESAHVAFYVDDADLTDFAGFEPSIWTSLADSWEGASNNGIYAKITSTFGPESDVDANGKLIVLFSDQLGAPENGGVLLGYFSSGDTLFERDDSANCLEGFNGADMFMMNGIGNLTAAGYSSSDVINRIYPDTLAHEFQHLINTNARCLIPATLCTQLEETWLNEGLSMVAEDVAGFGWNTERLAGELYLDRLPGPNQLSYNRRSLTTWEKDPVGNYQGSHSIVRYWADRYGEQILADLVSGTLRGQERTEAVLLTPFSRQLAEWATALMFSNESFSPSPLFDFTGASWTPLHADVGYVNYLPLNPGTGTPGQVRRDGWNAFVTGSGGGGNATLTVTSSEPVKPHVVVVRFNGYLQQCQGLPTGTVNGQCP